MLPFLLNSPGIDRIVLLMGADKANANYLYVLKMVGELDAFSAGSVVCGSAQQCFGAGEVSRGIDADAVEIADGDGDIVAVV